MARATMRPTMGGKNRRASARVFLSELAELLGLPSWETIDELNVDHYAEVASRAVRIAGENGVTDDDPDYSDTYLNAEMEAQTEVFRAYKGAVLTAVEHVFGEHHLAVEPLKIRVRGKSARVESDHDFRVVLAPGKTWFDAADAIRDTIEGVGVFGYEGATDTERTKAFLASGPYTARGACLTHLAWMKRRADVYGTTSAQRIYEGAWR